MTSWSLPGAPQGGGNATQNGPKPRQEDPKMVPSALLSIFQLLFSAQSALLRPTWRPRRPRSPFGTPQDAKLDEFDPRGLLFWTRGSENEKGKLKRKGEGKGKGEKIKSKLNSFSSESDRTEFSLRFGRVLHMLLGSL